MMKFIIQLLLITLCISCSKKNTATINQISMESPKQYENEWKEIDDLKAKNLPKSAIVKVNELYDTIKKTDNAPQIIKCLLYQANFAIELNDDGFIPALDKILTSQDHPNVLVQAIGQSILGDLYYNYAQLNQFQQDQRTEVLDDQGSDIRKMSIDQILKLSNSYYLKSTQHQLPTSYAIDYIRDILVKVEDMTKYYDMTIQNLLVIRALEHFTNRPSLVAESISDFNMNQDLLLSNRKDFEKIDLGKTDEMNFQSTALKYFQTELQNMQKQARLAAYIDMLRINFVYNNSNAANKEGVYKKRLEEYSASGEEDVDKAMIDYHLAYWYYQQGQKYNSNPEEGDNMGYTEAMKICKRVENTESLSPYKSKCKAIKETIEMEQMDLQIESVQIPDEKLLINLSYRNIDQVYFRIAKIDTEQRTQIEALNHNELPGYLSKIESLHSWKSNIKSENYNQHSTEVSGPELSFGYYMMLGSTDETFGNNAKTVFALFQVSDIGYSVQSTDTGIQIIVRDRTTGKPMPQAKIYVYSQSYQNRKIEYIEKAQLTTDRDGVASTSLGERNGIVLKVVKGDDVLDIRNAYSYYAQQYRGYQQIHVFTDRNLYRPGQVIHFNALVTSIDGNQIPKIDKNQRVKIVLRDANSQEIQSKELLTNDLGTAHGSFTIPASGLTGNYSLEVSSDSGTAYHSVSVEEYKRPKFEVIIEADSLAYKIGDHIEVEALVKMYAGEVPVTDAAVQYRVFRAKYYPYRCWWYPQPNGEGDREIAFGNLKTNDQGKVNIPFELVGDASRDNRFNAYYQYKIQVDVTDSNGETRSSEYTLSASADPFKIVTAIPEIVDRDHLDSLNFATQNMASVPVKTQGIIQIFSLKEETQVIRPRYWPNPDIMTISDQEYKADFQAYGHPQLKRIDQLAIDQKIWEQSYQNQSNIEVKPKDHMQAGIYKIKVTAKDQSNNEVISEYFIKISDHKNNKFPQSDILYSDFLDKEYQPGDKAVLRLGCHLKDLMVYVQVEKNKKIVSVEWRSMSQSQILEFPILEKDRGGFVIHTTYMYQNRWYSNSQIVKVPWTNKDIKIHIANMEKKILPGQEVEWLITFHDENDKPVQGELLATIYDASLDAIKGPNVWKRDFYPSYYSSFYWQTAGFNTLYFNTVNNERQYYPNIGSGTLLSPQIDYFGLSVYGSRGRYVARMHKSAPMMAESSAEMSDMVSAYNGGDAIQNENKESETSRESESTTNQAQNQFSIRRNLDETVFFYPDLRTDSKGQIKLKFKMNEALTQWKILLFGHSATFQYGFLQEELTTSKDLMIFPNMPRFLRQNDKVGISAKVQNLGKSSLKGKATLKFYDIITGDEVSGLISISKSQYDIAPNGNAEVSWEVWVPATLMGLLRYEIVAISNNVSDGEEGFLPILTDKIYLTEAQPIHVNGNSTTTKDLTWLGEKISENKGEQRLVLEFATNPIWYVIQALPHMSADNKDISSEIIRDIYVNALASKIVTLNPAIQTTFKAWLQNDSDELLSPLEKNQDLKNTSLNETPWVRQALGENAQKRDIALLFENNNIKASLNQSIEDIIKFQNQDGGLSWLQDRRSDLYTTQFFLECMGRLQKLNALPDSQSLEAAIQNARRYVIQFYIDKEKENNLNNPWTTDFQTIQYLYITSLYSNWNLTNDENSILKLIFDNAKKSWTTMSIYNQACLALYGIGSGNMDFAKDIYNSIQERSIKSAELGMYWKGDSGYSWNNNGLLQQAMAIELFDALNAPSHDIDQMKAWIIKNKQTNHWDSQFSSIQAIYGLFLDNTQISNTILQGLSSNIPVQISIDGKRLDLTGMNFQVGSLYFKKVWSGSDIPKNMKMLSVKNDGKSIAWGALYFQYFESIDKVKEHNDNPLSLSKKSFKKIRTEAGEKLVELKTGENIKVGDILVNRIVIENDRPMDYVYLKDGRAAGLEPLASVSSYKYEDGLGYYESPLDLATHLYISHLPKGTFVIENEYRVFHSGEYSSGIVSIQSYYAPEFVSHSNGYKLITQR